MNKNILIIYPHWPPSNLAGVHRARLISNFLPDFGWHPIVLTVESRFYEEKNDPEILRTVAENTEVHYVTAYPVTRPRIIGDIGLRAFFQLKKGALDIISKRNIDFIWIPIPSFYIALLGRWLHRKTAIPYGIDYIDPWVRDISNRKNVRSLLSLFMARILEPVAVKKAALISGVSEEYYRPVLERNFKKKKIEHVAMPYGFDPRDHSIKLSDVSYPWDQCAGCIPYVYAGAFLPNSGLFIKLLFKSIMQLKEEGVLEDNVRIYFIGTGHYSHKSIAAYAIDYGLSDIIIEINERSPYLHILNYLSVARGVLLLGSTEQHYTASKTFQSLLSGRPVYAILHEDSTAVQVFEDAEVDQYLVCYSAGVDEAKFQHEIKNKFQTYLGIINWKQLNNSKFGQYSSRESARSLTEGIDKVLSPFSIENS